jgi:hypothetical protein
MQKFVEDFWTVIWTGACALTALALYLALCVGPVFFTMIARRLSRRVRVSNEGPPAPAPRSPRHPWAFKGLPLGPRWQ